MLNFEDVILDYERTACIDGEDICLNVGEPFSYNGNLITTCGIRRVGEQITVRFSIGDPHSSEYKESSWGSIGRVEIRLREIIPDQEESIANTITGLSREISEAANNDSGNYARIGDIASMYSHASRPSASYTRRDIELRLMEILSTRAREFYDQHMRYIESRYSQGLRTIREVRADLKNKLTSDVNEFINANLPCGMLRSAPRISVGTCDRIGGDTEIRLHIRLHIENNEPIILGQNLRIP